MRCLTLIDPDRDGNSNRNQGLRDTQATATAVAARAHWSQKVSGSCKLCNAPWLVGGGPGAWLHGLLLVTPSPTARLLRGHHHQPIQAGLGTPGFARSPEH